MELRVDGVLYVPQAEAPLGGTYADALNLRMPDDCDAGANITVRDYLFELLIAVWDEGESFSGKRPFGNSGWEYDLYAPLIQAGLSKASSTPTDTSRVGLFSRLFVLRRTSTWLN
jgi:hypothetical protein